MKRLAVGLLLASMVLVAGAASATTIYDDPNVVLSSTVDGLTLWVLVANNGDVPVNQLFINLATGGFDADGVNLINADLAGSYVYKLDGSAVAFTLTATDLRGWDVAANYDGTMQRFWLPVTVLPHEYAVVKFVGSIEIGVFKAELGNIVQ